MLQKCHCLIEVVHDSLQTQKGLELVFRQQFLQNFLMKFFSLVIWHKLAVFDYSVKCISCFMLRHLMTSWNLKMQNSEVWFSWEWKELFLVWQMLLFTLKNKLVKMWQTQHLMWNSSFSIGSLLLMKFVIYFLQILIFVSPSLFKV